MRDFGSQEGRSAFFAFSPDGSRLAIGSQERSAIVWDTGTKEQTAVLRGHEGTLRALAYSPDGSRLATGSEDKTVRIWDPATGDELVVLEGHKGPVTSVAFSPDGSLLASGSEDATVRLWGLSNADIYRNRLASAERRKRLGPTVDGWFTGDLDAV